MNNPFLELLKVENKRKNINQWANDFPRFLIVLNKKKLSKKITVLESKLFLIRKIIFFFFLKLTIAKIYIINRVNFLFIFKGKFGSSRGKESDT